MKKIFGIILLLSRQVTGKKKFHLWEDGMARSSPPDGTWPALWLLCESINAVGWPAGGEIDVMNMLANGGANSFRNTQRQITHKHGNTKPVFQVIIPGQNTRQIIGRIAGLRAFTV